MLHSVSTAGSTPAELMTEAKKQVEMGLAHALSTEQYDPTEVEELLIRLYESYGKGQPRFIHVGSPKAGSAIQVDREFSIAGAQELYWLYLHRLIQRSKGTTPSVGLARIELLTAICERVGWLWPNESLCVIAPKPVELHLSPSKKLHNTQGPSIRWRDGYELYHLNGVRITELCDLLHRINLYKAGVTDTKIIKQILNIKNTAQRAEFIELLGIGTTNITTPRRGN